MLLSRPEQSQFGKPLVILKQHLYAVNFGCLAVGSLGSAGCLRSPNLSLSVPLYPTGKPVDSNSPASTVLCLIYIRGASGLWAFDLTGG